MMDSEKKITKITLDDLAGMVQRGFADVENRLGQRLDRLEHKTDRLEAGQVDIREGQDRIERKLDATITVTDRHDRQIVRLEKHVGLPPLVQSPSN